MPRATGAHFDNFGGHSVGGTPLPIPNREVKPDSADGTRGASPRESRTPPNYFRRAARAALLVVSRLECAGWSCTRRTRRSGTSSSSCGRGCSRDVPAIVAACNDPETARWTTVPSPYTEADARAWIERCATAWSEGAAPLAVVERSSGELAAAITLWLHGRDRRARLLGGARVPRPRLRAAGRRAPLRVGVRRARSCRGCSSGRSRATLASERVAEKCGFTREGVLRAWMEQRGERRDVTMWSLLPGDPA